jgi:hypothetical protein
MVCTHLKNDGIEAVMSGGAVVTIYTHARFQSYDLDFITIAERKKIQSAMKRLGFEKNGGRYYTHPRTKFLVEFPSPPLAIGNELIRSWKTISTKFGSLFLLTPTQCVMDRLCAYYHWNDFPSLEQALLVTQKQKINLKKIEDWSLREGMQEKFEHFLECYKKHRAAKRQAK